MFIFHLATKTEVPYSDTGITLEGGVDLPWAVLLPAYLDIVEKRGPGNWQQKENLEAIIAAEKQREV